MINQEIIKAVLFLLFCLCFTAINDCVSNFEQSIDKR